jgi:hypothetical protein
LRFGVSDLFLLVSCLGFRVWGLGSGVEVWVFGDWGLGFGVEGRGFRTRML